jgi:O-antigen/teichoic acid export membrane protein
MTFFEKQVAVRSQPGTEQVWIATDPACDPAERGNNSSGVLRQRELRHLLATFVTTLTCFGIFLIQGILIARILGPVGRGEFGSAIYFPRDILLYAGLLGGVEIVNAYARRPAANSQALRYSAARLGLASGLITSLVAMLLVLATFSWLPEKSYLIPICLLCCVFVPFEHLQLTISAVDRGIEAYTRYNINRLVFALAFPLLVLIVFGLDEVFRSDSLYRGLDQWLGGSKLLLMCLVFIASRAIGLIPTLRGMQLWPTFKNWRAGVPATDQPDDSASPHWRQLLSEGRPYAVSMFASELFERLDIFLILAIGTIKDCGFYFVAVPAAALLTVPPNAMGVFTFNAGADPARTVSVRQAVTVMLGIAALQLAATLVFVLIIPYLIVAFYTSEFSAAIPFAMWLLPACAIKGYLQAIDGYLKGRGKPMIGVWSRVLSIFVMLAFVAVAYSRFELLSIPMAACVGQFVSMLIISSAALRDVVLRNQRHANPSGGTH